MSRPTSPLGLETKTIAFPVEARDGVLRGYASLFGQPDQCGDVVLAGAFRRSLGALAASGRSVKFLWQHDPSQPIGVWEAIREDARGLRVEGRILLDVAQGAEALALVRAGAVDGLSIGYRTVRSAENRETGGRRLLELDLWEVSLVTFPMLPSARASLDWPRKSAAGDVLAAALVGALAGTCRPSGDDLAV